MSTHDFRNFSVFLFLCVKKSIHRYCHDLKKEIHMHRHAVFYARCVKSYWGRLPARPLLHFSMKTELIWNLVEGQQKSCWNLSLRDRFINLNNQWKPTGLLSFNGPHYYLQLHSKMSSFSFVKSTFIKMLFKIQLAIIFK